MRPAQLLVHAKNNAVDRCEIRPAWNGTGRYVIWIRTRGSCPGGALLSHEDGAPLLFRDSRKAYEKAVQCGVSPRLAHIRWPPAPPPSKPSPRLRADMPVLHRLADGTDSGGTAMRAGILDMLLMSMSPRIRD